MFVASNTVMTGNSKCALISLSKGDEFGRRV